MIMIQTNSPDNKCSALARREMWAVQSCFKVLKKNIVSNNTVTCTNERSTSINAYEVILNPLPLGLNCCPP